MHVYVENIKNPGVRFEVMEYDTETKIAKLKGSFGVIFSRNISKAEMEKHGYKIVKSEEVLSLVPPPVTPAAPAKKAKVEEPAEEEE